MGLCDRVAAIMIIISLAAASLSPIQPCTHFTYADDLAVQPRKGMDHSIPTDCETESNDGQLMIDCCFASGPALLSDDLSLLDNDNWSRSHEMARQEKPSLVPSHPWRPPA